MRRVLIASVVHQDPDVLRAHLATVTAQAVTGVVCDLTYIIDISDPNAQTNADILVSVGARFLNSFPKDANARYAVAEETHDWSVATFAWLGREKQRLLGLARDEGYDAILLVDSDLLLGTGTLRSLLAADKDVVSAVFWTAWSPNTPPLPQVWLSHPYEFQGRGLEAHEFLQKLANRELVRVNGLGACTLIQRRALDKVAYFPPLEGLPSGGMWQGEDRHFCIGAARNRVELWADAWPDVWHCYRPHMRAEIPARMNELAQTCTGLPVLGDLVSFTLEPCEEPALAQYKEHIRGRLGALKLLPEIESALAGMVPGDARFLRVRFPLWYDLAAYRGQSKVIRLTLLSVKPYASSPTLDESHLTVGQVADAYMERPDAASRPQMSVL